LGLNQKTYKLFPRRERMDVCIVDDDYRHRILIKEALRDFSCYEVSCGYRALADPRLLKSSVVVTDLQMRRMQGDELVRRLHEMEWEGFIIGVSAHHDAESYFMNAGADAFVPKNFPSLSTQLPFLVQSWYHANPYKPPKP
jgi:CheY-like chemotaxis protein